MHINVSSLIQPANFNSTGKLFKTNDNKMRLSFIEKNFSNQINSLYVIRDNQV